jgi:probable addiction module antidote protein
MSNENFAPFDPAEHLETEEAIAAFLDGVMEDGGDDPAYVAQALGVVARARNLSQLARDVGMSRQGLVKSLSGDGNPSFATVVKVAQALGLRVAFEPAKAASETAPREAVPAA